MSEPTSAGRRSGTSTPAAATPPRDAQDPGPEEPGGPATAVDSQQTSPQAFEGPPTGPPASSPEQQPTIPGYEVVGVLGRGGMGVVYKARQLSLKRLIALKMILAGEHVGPEPLARFRTEAEAVARLQHPNIVQIHEIGAHQGHPFFCLEFVDGGSLAQHLAGQPRPFDQAVRLVELLARAVHYTHQRGIIHRDLKPANVLLARSDHPQAILLGGAAYEPKISDFGLAKQLEAEAGQTHSGAVMGTPSYMAPEQAAGRVHEVGPPADVYALGAILYECLTGRPPFRADSTLETLRQVLADDPVPPSRLRPGVPRDVETMCLKALAKEPARRYPSALALAEDLARFAAGEPILARRAGAVSRLWRKVRRRPLTLTVALLVTAAVAPVSYFVLKDTRSSRADALIRQLDAGMEVSEWPEGHLAGLEGWVADLERLDPDKAAAARGRLFRRFARAVRESFSPERRPVLRPEDVTRIGANLDALASRDTALAETVRLEFRERLRKPQDYHLRPPFNDLGAFFTSPSLRAEGTGLVRHGGSEGPVLHTAVPCLGTVALESVFSPAWDNASQLGLVLNGTPTAGYQFLLRVKEDVTAEGGVAFRRTPGSFAQARSTRGTLSAVILRNGDQLREQPLEAADVGSGPLTLVAGREGARLSFQVNNLPPVVFYDLFPLVGSDPGRFGLLWPADVPLERLRASSQVLPESPSPLEAGDEAYSQGRFAEALAAYQQQDLAGSAGEAGQEVRYKLGACLVRLNRYEEAAPVLEALAAAPGRRWPLLAGCQLWVVRLRQNRLQDAGIAMLNLAQRSSPDQLAEVLPGEVRHNLVGSYSVEALGAKFVQRDPDRVPKLESVMALADLIRTPDHQRMYIRLSLLRAYHLAGQLDRAVRLAEEMLRDPALAGPWADETAPHLAYRWRVLEEYGWLMGLRGEPARALAEVDTRLFRAPGTYLPASLPLLLERSRLHAALGRWADAEHDVDEFFRHAPGYEVDYRYTAEAALVRGFLRRRRGDEAGAATAWHQGVYKIWAAGRRQARPDAPPLPDQPRMAGTEFVTNLILSALTRSVTEADAESVVAQMIAYAIDDQSAAAFKDLLRISPAVLSDTWRSPRGYEAARRIGFREVTWSEYLRLSAVFTGVAILREGALPGVLSQDQEAVLWQAAEGVYDAYFSTGELGKRHLFALSVTWKGLPGLLGWAGVAPSLSPKLRGPLAYVLGHRQLRLGKRQEAAGFFGTALADAAPGSPLHQLAQSELDQVQPR